MQIAAIIQARLGSSRLPGKVLMPVLGKPMLQWQVERLKQSKQITDLVIATSDLPSDDPLVQFCATHNINYYRGSETDVLARFYGAATVTANSAADEPTIIIRLTGDCPLVDPNLIDEGVAEFLRLHKSGCSYQGYAEHMPDGMNFEVFTFAALKEAYERATDPFEREHVTPYLWRNPERFGVQHFSKSNVVTGLHFSVDRPADLELVRAIFEAQQNAGRFFGINEISNLFRTHPELSAINASSLKNEGLFKTALASEQYKLMLSDKTVTRYSVLIPTEAPPSESFLDWCKKIGITVWRTKESAIQDWPVVVCRLDWKTVLTELLAKTPHTPLLLQTADTNTLAEVLTFLLRTRFQSKP